MKLLHLSPILWTENLDETVSFHETVLGFKGKSDFPNFASLTKGNVEIMFLASQDEDNDSEGEEGNKDFFPKPLLTGGLFITTDEVDNLWASVKDRTIVKTAIEDRAYLMRDFSILDNNVYELVFGQDISNRTP